MVGDIEDALELNVLPFRASDAEAGRVTTAMAYMLYAEIVMYQRDNSPLCNRLRYMKEIIDSPEYDLWPTTATIFKEAANGARNLSGKSTIYRKTPYATGVLPSLPAALCSPLSSAPTTGPAGRTDTTAAGVSAPLRLETYERYSADDTRRDATMLERTPLRRHYNKRYQDFGFFLEKVCRTGRRQRRTESFERAQLQQ